jgi:hypothetical protein
MHVVVEQADRRNPDSPVTVRITTTLPGGPVLHWGVRRTGKHDDWARPSDSILPYGAFPPFGTAAELCMLQLGLALEPRAVMYSASSRNLVHVSCAGPLG